MQRILLTGANGFLGSHLLEGLLSLGYRVVILKRSTSDLWRIIHLVDRVKAYDIDKESVEKSFEEQKIDIVIHTACQYGRNNDAISSIVESNLMFGLKVLDASLKYGVETFINTDTMLKKQLNNYTLSKSHLLDWLQKFSDEIQVVNIKIEHMYGLKDDSTKFIHWVLRELKDNAAEINLTSGVQQRDFIYIDDVVSAYLLLITKLNNIPKYFEVELGTGNLISVRSFLQKLKRVFEIKFGASQTSFNFGAIPYRKGEDMSIEVDNESLVNLGWESKVSVEQGLENIMKGM